MEQRASLESISGVSVVICCYNSATRLPETLRHLTGQCVPENIPWEVVVIDNASTDDTAQTAERLWSVNDIVRLRVVSEPNPGTGNARHRGIVEANHEIISFLDDDNWVPQDWISRVATFFREHPEATMVGGPSKPVFERPPPMWFPSVAIQFAVGSQFTIEGDITDQPGTLLWTAGTSLRRQAAINLFNAGFQFISCVDSVLALKRGEDAELCYALRASGGRLYYDSSMAIEHFMPVERLVWKQALKHSFVIGAPSPLLGIYVMALGFPPFEKYPSWKQTWPFQTLKSLLHLMQLIITHPIACLTKAEGSLHAIHFQQMYGQIVTSVKMCGQYGALFEKIRTSPWAQDSRQNSAQS